MRPVTPLTGRMPFSPEFMPEPTRAVPPAPVPSPAPAAASALIPGDARPYPCRGRTPDRARARAARRRRAGGFGNPPGSARPPRPPPPFPRPLEPAGSVFQGRSKILDHS